MYESWTFCGESGPESQRYAMREMGINAEARKTNLIFEWIVRG